MKPHYGGLLSSSFGGLVAKEGMKGDFTGPMDGRTTGLKELDTIILKNKHKIY